jgi:predicted P-loop ATPase
MKDVTKRLYDMGFAIHWLQERSKRPIKTKWSEGPRATWPELLGNYKKHLNIGVRLGAPSELKDGTFLAVIDCDVKSKEPKHYAELVAVLAEKFPDLKPDSPRVLSGRGNGSCHYYIKTPDAVRARMIAQSEDLVKVKTNGDAKPSKRDREQLSDKELEKGFRIRAAWEVSLMGTGQQVVLPPSIHPDSLERYQWENEIESVASIPMIDIPDAAKGVEKDLDFKVNFVDVSLTAEGVDEETVLLVTEGEGGGGDKSADLFTACLHLVKFGLSNDQILSVLTDEANYLGDVGFKHAKTGNRYRAAKWVYDYSLKKARLEVDAREQFKAEVVTETLPDAEAKKQETELLTVNDWQMQIERTSPQQGAKPKNSLKNVVLILTKGVAPNLFKLDEFSNAVSYGVPAPWGRKTNQELEDVDPVLIKKFMADKYRLEPSSDKVIEAITLIAHQNRHHPVRDYLNSLEWDGVPRAGTWLKRHLKAQAPEPYLTAVSKKTLVALVARVFEPGRKYDHVLILIGGQGKGKSTAIRHLVGNDWFSDAHINISDKDAVLAMRSKWLIELGELSSMSKADSDQMKEFVSRTTDRIRVPYGRFMQNFARQCIFIGTTNRDEFLKDETGNRRFWPVHVGMYDFKSLKKERDQLFAEAKFLYELEEPLYLENDAAAKLATEQQKNHMIHDVWAEQIETFFEREMTKSKSEFPVEQFLMGDLFGPGGPLQHAKDGVAEQRRAAAVLRILGFQMKVSRGGRGVKHYWFRGHT